jgi:hypothetical protein
VPILCYSISTGIPKSNIFDQLVASCIIRDWNNHIERGFKVSKVKVAVELIAYPANHRNLHVVSCEYLRRREDKIIDLILLFLKMNVDLGEICLMNPRIRIHDSDKYVIVIKSAIFPISSLKMFNTPADV